MSKIKRKQLPYGVQDYLPGECYNKYLIEQTLSNFFYLNGFDRIEPSAIEYLDTFSDTDINKLFKFTDSDGSLLALRNDPTVQISRIAATKPGGTQRLYYVVNSYEYLMNSTSARTREFAQAGIELINGGSDTEVIVLAIEALLKCGFTQFTIDIGQVDYFNGIIQNLNLDLSQERELIMLINNKNNTGIGAFLKENNIDGKTADGISAITGLFGGAEVLDNASADNPLSRSAVGNLKKTVSELRSLGFEKYISIDLGLLPESYYTGIVLRGYVAGLGLTVLNGGRYDSLGGGFGNTATAVGWAIGIKRLLTALEKQKSLKNIPQIDYGYITDTESLALAKEYTDKLKADGKRVVRLENKVNAKGVKAILIFENEKMKEEVLC